MPRRALAAFRDQAIMTIEGRYEMNRRTLKFYHRAGLFREYYRRLSAASGLERIARYPQHGTTSRLLHSVAVAYYSYRLAQFTGLSFHEEDLVRGALLHDYFLYDPQDGDPAHKGHWSRHPEIALENAGRELKLTGIETDIIKKHMFPLTPKPPRCREAVFVTLTDKACSVYEFFRRKNPYQRLRRDVMGADSLASQVRPVMEGSFGPGDNGVNVLPAARL